MVNEKQHIKDRILEQLYNAGGRTVSGVRLSEILGVSRVAVWKQINAIKKSGIQIVSTPKGYTLSSARDLLLPFCFQKPLQDRVFYFNELGSTMDQARTLAKDGAPHLSVVIAENQTGGRGRASEHFRQTADLHRTGG